MYRRDMEYLALTLPGGKTVQPPSQVPTGGLDTLSSGISVALTFMIIIAIILSLFYLVYGGVQWTASGGDKGKITSARAKITYALIGLIVAVTSFFLINFIGNFFGVSLLNNN
jgi:magnesium-transporting ATPase (P-type)